MVQLSRDEQETIINVIAGDKEASVYSCDPFWIRRLQRLSKEFPDVFRLGRQTEESVEYYFPKKYVKIARPRKPCGFALQKQKVKDSDV